MSTSGTSVVTAILASHGFCTQILTPIFLDTTIHGVCRVTHQTCQRFRLWSIVRYAFVHWGVCRTLQRSRWSNQCTHRLECSVVSKNTVFLSLQNFPSKKKSCGVVCLSGQDSTTHTTEGVAASPHHCQLLTFLWFCTVLFLSFFFLLAYPRLFLLPKTDLAQVLQAVQTRVQMQSFTTFPVLCVQTCACRNLPHTWLEQIVKRGDAKPKECQWVQSVHQL